MFWGFQYIGLKLLLLKLFLSILFFLCYYVCNCFLNFIFGLFVIVCPATLLSFVFVLVDFYRFLRLFCIQTHATCDKDSFTSSCFSLYVFNVFSCPCALARISCIKLKRSGESKHSWLFLPCPFDLSWMFFFLFFSFFFFFLEMEFRCCYPDWSAMAQSWLTTTSAFWVQAILLPQPPE